MLGWKEPGGPSRRVKRILWSAILSFPLAFGMTAAGDSAAVTNTFRCLFSPGLVLAAHLVTVPNKHLGIWAAARYLMLLIGMPGPGAMACY